MIDFSLSSEQKLLIKMTREFAKSELAPGLIDRDRHSRFPKKHNKESPMVKLFASKIAMDSAIECVQIHGNYGYIQDYGVKRLMRDAKVTEIYEGTSEIQELVISRELTKCP